jgi:hypothetical protein
MSNLDLSPKSKKELLQFYKGIKMASQLMPKGNHIPNQKALFQLLDQIIAELKKENPDEARVQQLTDNLQSLTREANS